MLGMPADEEYFKRFDPSIIVWIFRCALKILNLMFSFIFLKQGFNGARCVS